MTIKELSVIPLQAAVFCESCQCVSNSRDDSCMVCGAYSIVSLSRLIAGDFMQQSVNDLYQGICCELPTIQKLMYDKEN